MKTIKILCSLLCTMLLAALPATAQNNDDKNKAIIETNEGSQELNTDDIQLIRFDGGKVTVVQPWGDTFFDRTLRSLTFQRPNPGTLRLTASTTIDTESTGNRAQTIDGDGKLASTWASGDVVYVYADASTTTSIGTLYPKSDDYGKSTAPLTGNINATGLANNQTLYFSTKDRATLDLSQQDGTVESLFYFTATGTLTIDGGNASITNLTFSRPIAIVKFTLKDKADGTSPVYAKSLTVNDGTSNYVITPAALSNVLFVGIPAITSQTVTLTASDGLSSYSYERANVTFEDNGYYAINVKMTNTTDFLSIPLTFEAKTAGAVVSFSSTMDTTPTIEYSLNGGDWTTYSSSITLTNVGDKVSFRGNNATYASISDGKFSSFSCNKDCYIYGNIMSLISKDGFASATSLTENDVFYLMFYNNTHICNHASKTLKLPATTLTQYCYHGLFYGCSNLTKAPELPATTLAFYCYAHMFSNCTHLTTAPALPATTLATSCYRSMFQGCTSLTTAPALPATTLASSCYTDMFQGCTHLTTAPAALPATTLADYCYQQMFYGCTSLTTAPILPATELKTQCYYCMFLNCSKLNSVTCLATDISASNCTGSWLNNVAASGTFYKASSMESWTTGANGIPSGWTTKNYVEGALKGEFTINSGGGKVSFSQGNLQYQASTDTWRFAEHQYDMIGSDNANISNSYTGWIDLFGWGTGNNPTNSSTNNNDYGTFTDWGVNAISNGGNTSDLWRTLGKDEWVYLFEHHTKRWSTVNDINGYVIRPDGVSTAIAASYTASEWAVEEAAGSVFLPAAGSRGGTSVGGAGLWGDYWSSTPYNSNDAYYLYLYTDALNPANRTGRAGGRSVRLVYEIPFFQGAGTEADPYLISSEVDWNYLAVKVNSGTNYAGKFFRLTTDIDITTMVGNSESNSFCGTFDGDGHTLTISYNTTSDYTAPFRYIQGATFKNLKVTGSITTTMNLAAGIAGLNTGSAATFEQCVTDIAITSSSSTEVGWGAYDYHGGFLARSNSANVNLTDCVCGGSADGSSSSKSKCAGFVGVAENCTVSATRCLSTTSYINVSSWNSLCHQAGANRTVNVFYYVNANDVGEDVGTQVTTSQLADGSYATALQAGRSTTVWVQYSRTNQPMLKQFTKYTVTYHANGGSGSVPAAQARQQGDDLTLSNSTLTFGGFTHTGWNTNSDGSGTHYDIGGTYSANADVTLYAEWTATFNYTGAVQTFTVPATGYYTLECYGAQGGYSSGGLGGKGGLSQLTYPLTKGDVLYIYVGGQGECIDGSSSHPTGGDGGWNGGGNGGTGVQFNGQGTPYNGGGGGGGATHIATNAIGAITSTTDFNANHDGLLLIAGGGGGGTSWNNNAGGAGGGAEGGKGRHNNEWNIAWNNGTLSCGRDGMTSSTGGGSAEGCGGGGAGYVGGNTWTVTYNASEQSYSGAGGSSWGDTTNGKGYSTTSSGATDGGNGKAVITWYGTTYPTE